MDAYPPEYVKHNLPFIALSGLEVSEADEDRSIPSSTLFGNGPDIVSEMPLVAGERAEGLVQALRGAELSAGASSVGSEKGNPAFAFRMKVVGRVGTVPQPSTLPSTCSMPA